MTEVTRKASAVVADLERWLSGGQPSFITLAHGAPDADVVRRNIDALRRLGHLTVTFDIPDTRKEPAVQTVPPPKAAPDPVSKVLHAAHDHSRKSIRDLATRIETLLDRLESDIEAENKKIAAAKAKAEMDQKVKAEIKRLEARIRQLKSGRRGGEAGGPQNCGECGREFTSAQAVSMHRRRAHEGFDPNAAKAAS